MFFYSISLTYVHILTLNTKSHRQNMPQIQ